MTPLGEDNRLVLPLLGMLRERPASSAELAHEFGPNARYEHLDHHSASVYSTILAMSEAGWLRSDKDGQKALHVVYELTEAGFEELCRRMRAAIQNASWTSGHEFVTALAYIGELDTEAAANLLDQRVIALQQRLDDFLADGERHERSTWVQEKDDYLAARTRTEIEWLSGYRDRLGGPAVGS